MKKMKNVHPSLIGIGLLLALAACRPGAAEFTEKEAPNHVTLDNASTVLALNFGRGSTRLAAADAARLHATIVAGGLVPTDRVTVAVGGTPALAASRFSSLASELLHYGIIATALPPGGAGPNQAILQSARYLVTLPACPNWSKQASLDFTNTLSSNYGCSDAVNLGLMVATPADLAEGRPVGYADAIPASAAVQRYVADRIVLPAAANISPIAGTATAAPGGGSNGAGTAGAQP